MTRKNSLFTPQRQSGYAIVIILLKFIRMLIRQLWPLLLVLFVNRSDKVGFWISVVAIAIGGLSLIGSVIAYFKFYYFVEGDNLRIDKGLFRRTSIDLPFERIQTVDFEQNVIHQVFNVVRVNIDSAGTKGNEISFDALSLDNANELRDYILAQKAELVGEDEEASIEKEPDDLIVQLSDMDLVKIGIGQNHLRTAGIILAAIWALAENISQALGRDIYEMVGEEAENIVRGSIFILLLLIPILFIASFLFTLFNTVLKYYDLKFSKTSKGFKLVSGLLTRKEKSAQKDKIQIIAWATNPLRRLFKMYTMSLYQASSVEVIGGKSIAVPGVYAHHIDATVRSVIPDALDVEYEDHGIHPLARFRFILFAGLLPCLAFTGIAIITQNMSLLFAWLYFPLAIYMGILYHRKRQLRLHTDYLMTQSGIFATRKKVLEIYKIQCVKVSQSFYQWRKDLATVTMYTASGDVSIPFVPIDKARQISDYILYRVERDGREWM